MKIDSDRAALHVYLLIAMLLALHSTISVRCSLSDPKTDNSYNGNSKERNSSLLPCFTRYALESFFKENGSCNDSSLQEYLVQKVPFGSDGSFARLWDFERRLIGKGSHRRLSSSFRFSIESDLIADISMQMCEVIIIERLPNGVFADPFELEHLIQLGVFRDAFVFGDTNLEFPSFLSKQSIAEVHLGAALDKSAGKEITQEFNIEIPLHARYPPLEESGYSRVSFGVPDLYIRCKKHGESNDQSCVLKPISSSVHLIAGDIVWSIPAGMKAHSTLVSLLTFTSALLSAILIILASFRHAPVEEYPTSELDEKINRYISF